MRDDVYDALEERGRAIVTRLAARWAAELRAGDPAAEHTEAALAQTRAYQALLIGHVDFARRPCRPQDEPAVLRGHVELLLAVLRLMENVSRGRRRGRSGGGA
jgi:hypothetical protein